MDSLEKRLFKFIAHSEVLEKVSVNYQKLAFAASLDRCRDMKRTLKYYDFKMPQKELAKMILMHQKYLYAILPSSKNTSYKSSVDRLQQIIADAKARLEPIFPLIQQINNSTNGIGLQEKFS